MTAMAVTFRSSASDQTAVSRSMLYRGWAYWVILAVICGPSLFALSAGDGGIPAGVLVAVTCAGIGVWYLLPWVYTLSLRRGFRDPDGPYTVTFGDSGVVVDAPHGTVQWKWSAVYQARETRQHFLLYVAKHQAQFVPKRAVSTEQAAAMRAMLIEKLAGRAMLAG